MKYLLLFLLSVVTIASNAQKTVLQKQKDTVTYEIWLKIHNADSILKEAKQDLFNLNSTSSLIYLLDSIIHPTDDKYIDRSNLKEYLIENQIEFIENVNALQLKALQMGILFRQLVDDLERLKKLNKS